jgi:hypothetical protein
MKHKLTLMLSAAAVVLLMTAFMAGTAYANTGCFNDTNGHWAETFICWMRENGLSTGYGDGGYHPDSSITRAEMAVFLKAQAEIPPSTGNIYVSASLNNWVKTGLGNHAVDYNTYGAYLHAPGSGTYGFFITPDLTATLYGRQFYLHGARICYDATHGASINYVDLIHWNGEVNPTIYNEVDDSTPRTDAVCRTYTFPSDGSFWGGDHVSLYISISVSSSYDYVKIANTSFILVPSSIPGVLSLQGPNASRPSLDMP